MKNLHLMPMNSDYENNMIHILNENMLPEENVFVFKTNRDIVSSYNNCIVDLLRFSVDYINKNYMNYKHIVLHSLFFNNNDILKLEDEAAKKIIWCVWGHDLYNVSRKPPLTFRRVYEETLHFIKMVIRGTHLKIRRDKKEVARKIRLFAKIGISSFGYDRYEIIKKFGSDHNVVTAPYFSKNSTDYSFLLEERKKREPSECVNILIGHCGFYFIEHEKYLKKLARYKNRNIHVYLVLSYGASDEEIQRISELANRIYGKEKCTIMLNMIPQEDFFRFLTTIDIGIFPYLHQSGLGNVGKLAMLGAKLYFDPRGVLYKGYKLKGYVAADCRKIGRISYKKFIDNPHAFNGSLLKIWNNDTYEQRVKLWKDMLA